MAGYILENSHFIYKEINMKWLVFSLLMLGFVGCNSTQDMAVDKSIVTTFQAKPSSNKARVIFFRKGNFVGGGVYFSILSKGNLVGKLKNGTYFTRQFTPGDYIFTTCAEFSKDNELPMHLVAGQEYYVEGIIMPGLFGARGRLLSSTKEHALEYIQNSKHAEESDGTEDVNAPVETSLKKK